MTIAFRASSVTQLPNNVGTSSVGLFLPFGARVGDLLLAVVAGGDATSSVSGWTRVPGTDTIPASGGLIYRNNVFYRFMQSGDVSWTFQAGSSGPLSAVVLAYSGFTPSVQITASVPKADNVSSTDVATWDAVSTSGIESAVVYLGHFYSAGARWSGISGATNRAESLVTAGNASQEIVALDNIYRGSVASAAPTAFALGTTSSGLSSALMTLRVTDPNLAPNASALVAPVNNVSIDQGSAQRLDWEFSDPNVGDSQSAYDLRYRVVGATAWTTVNASSSASHRDFAAGFFALGQYEWQVRTYDAAGLVGPYSASGFFTVGAAPAGPAITAPPNGSTVGAGTAVVTWSTSSQDAYQIRTVADAAGSPDTAVVYYDSGTVEFPSARSASVPFPVNSRTEHIQVRTRSAGLWSPWASVRVLVSYTPPPTPTLTLTPSDATASIAVLISAAAPAGGQPAIQAFDLFRRQTQVGGEGIRIAKDRAAGTFTDFTPASGVDYQYRAVAYGNNGTTSTSPWLTGGEAVPVVPINPATGEPWDPTMPWDPAMPWPESGPAEGYFVDSYFTPPYFD